jgi:transcriptional repressor AefR-like protein
VQDKLAGPGIEGVERLIDETIGITRATIAEADRFPALSRQVHEHGRDRAAAAVSNVLSDATRPLSRGTKGTFGPKRSVSTAQIFMDLIPLPMMMRALIGEGAKELRSELPAFVRERVSFFMAACETDWRK